MQGFIINFVLILWGNKILPIAHTSKFETPEVGIIGLFV